MDREGDAYPLLAALIAARHRFVIRSRSAGGIWAHSIARLGGHITNNGEAGWMVLGRGYEKLLLLEQGWLAARRTRSDQS